MDFLWKIINYVLVHGPSATRWFRTTTQGTSDEITKSTPRFELNGGELVIKRLEPDITGEYNCLAGNLHRTIQVSPASIPEFVRRAKQQTEQAIQNTIKNLRDESKNHTRKSSVLFQLLRFPVQDSLRQARNSAIFQRALKLASRASSNNITAEFDFYHEVDPNDLIQIRQLSDCLPTSTNDIDRLKEECHRNLCFHLKYRSFDGQCNNLDFPYYGNSFTPFTR